MLFERGRGVHDAPSWEEAGEEMQEWLLGHADAALEAVGFSRLLSERDELRKERAIWRPQLGDPVTITAASQYAADYERTVLYVAGITAEQQTGEPNVWLSDAWPPRHHGDVTDGWRMEEITPARQALSPEGDGR